MGASGSVGTIFFVMEMIVQTIKKVALRPQESNLDDQNFNPKGRS